MLSSFLNGTDYFIENFVNIIVVITIFKLFIFLIFCLPEFLFLHVNLFSLWHAEPFPSIDQHGRPYSFQWEILFDVIKNYEFIYETKAQIYSA